MSSYNNYLFVSGFFLTVIVVCLVVIIGALFWLFYRLKYENAVIIDDDPCLYHAVKDIVDGTDEEKERFVNHVSSDVYKD